MYTENDWRDYLAHSGVLVMQWYVRMGPPYPLKPEQHSASEKKLDGKKVYPVIKFEEIKMLD